MGLGDTLRKLRAEMAERQKTARSLEHMSDEFLVGTTARPDSPRLEIEMQRRLKDSVQALTKETVTSRESSERLTGQLDTSIKTLKDELIAFRTSSATAAGTLERLTRWLIGFTIVLVVLTVAVLVLTVIVVRRHG